MYSNVFITFLEDVSNKITEEKVVQRLTQLLEQSGTLVTKKNIVDSLYFLINCFIYPFTVLQTSQSDFQPSLDALRDISTDDDGDIYTHTFDIDLNYLADCINSFPIHERLDLNPSYCEVSFYLCAEDVCYTIVTSSCIGHRKF